MTCTWRITVVTPAAAAPWLERALEPFADLALSVVDASPSVTRRSAQPQPATWQTDVWLAEMCLVEALTASEPRLAEVAAALAVGAAAAGISPPEPRIEPVPPRDWVAETYRGFPEISVGRYRVRGSHVREAPPPGTIPITIDAAVAFGTGEHETTRGCLEALDRLRRESPRQRVLDVGCGSGILAIAAAKTWPCAVIASDIDARAVQVARENARINGVARRMAVLAADGYRARRVRGAMPYDLIFSNILARPLVKLAPQLAYHLAAGGVAVLSGFLNWQERQVLSAHAAQGLHLLFRIVHGDWTTTVLGKP